MIAIYARQSVDRADSISIENQLEYCRYETRGAPYQTYIDRGYSGKNTDRPAYCAMIADMESGKINKVVVYKLDRISRSILDFSGMMEQFERYRVEFVSTTEKFDTASPMGRAMLNICIVFAQLERETIQKRVADAYYSRSRKSLYMGGRVPYGFRLEPAVIDGIKTSRYVVQPEEAAQIRLIHELYARPEASYGDIIAHFAARGITKNGKPWVRSRLGDILRNPIYVRADLGVYEFYRGQGALVVNSPSDFIGVNGCYFYRGKEHAGRGNPEGGSLVLAPHEGIVDASLWLQCRAKARAAGGAGSCRKAKNTWLAGKIKCGVCGYALVDKQYKTRAARYLLCSHRNNARACVGPGTLYTDDIEALIHAQMRKKMAQFPVLRGKGSQTANPAWVSLRLEQAQVEAEIEALLDKLPQAEPALFAHINRRVGQLDEKKHQIRQRISELQARREDAVRTVNSHLNLWERLSFADKRRTVAQLIESIHVTGESIRIQWRF